VPSRTSLVGVPATENRGKQKIAVRKRGTIAIGLIAKSPK
jgi:hypothetical protein